MQELKVGLEWGLPLPGLGHHEQIIVTNALIAGAVMLLIFYLVCRTAKLKPGTAQAMIEVVVENGEKYIRDIAGVKVLKYLPFCLSLFLFIFAADLIGIIPGFVSPTSELSVNAAMALCVFVMTFYVGIRELGLKKYLRHKMGPILALGPIFILLESVGEFFRPVSLSLRLFGNIKGEDIFALVMNNLVMSANELVPFLHLGGGHLQVGMAQFVMPLVYWLMALTSFLQACIFAFLPIIYFGAAVGWGEDEH